MRTIRVGGFFSGIGAHVSACERLSDRAEFVHVFQCEVDEKTARQHDTIHGEIPNLGDITKVHDIGGDRRVDILYWTPPCIRKGDRVLTGCGYVPIEEVEAGDSVLSHDGKWHDVEWAGKTGDKKVLSIKTELGSSVGATEDHLFYACRCVDGKFTEPEWVQAKDLTTAHYLGRPPAHPVKTRTYRTEWQWSRICHIHRDPRIHEVYDLTVQDAHSFVVNEVVVHNCQDISNAGKGQGNTKGSGTRSSLAYEVPRILANTPQSERPKYLVMEEVPMMLADKYIGNFRMLLAELTQLGYNHRYGILNAADCGVAQSRRRCFVISKLGGTPPDLPRPIPLDKCLRDYLEPEPVDRSYYLSEDRLKGLIWSNQKEEEKGYGYRFEPLTEREREAHSVTTHAGSRKTDNYIRIGADDELSRTEVWGKGIRVFDRRYIADYNIALLQEP